MPLAGATVGAICVALTLAGNPPNMGLCVACFQRDIAGSLGLHRAAPVQCLRLELIGICLGALAAALATAGFKPRGSASPVTRSVLAMFVMIGALAFLGCPLRMALRIAGGDLNALVGAAGFATGVGAGIAMLRARFTLGRAGTQSKAEGSMMAVAMLALLLLLALKPVLGESVPPFFSQKGPGAMYPGGAASPVRGTPGLLIALSAGIIVGVIAQRVGICQVACLRDLVIAGSFQNILVFGTLVVIVFAGNLTSGRFRLGFDGQPIAHTAHLWNFLSMALVGSGSVLLGGCPLRQLVAGSTGSSDAAAAVVGMVVGAAIAHNFGLAASPKGVPTAGKVGVIVGLVVVLAIGMAHRSPKPTPKAE